MTVLLPHEYNYFGDVLIAIALLLCRGSSAQEEGRFEAEMVPVEVKVRKGVETMTRDEHARPDITEQQLAKLPPVFKKEGTVTAGNASVSHR